MTKTQAQRKKWRRVPRYNAKQQAIVFYLFFYTAQERSRIKYGFFLAWNCKKQLETPKVQLLNLPRSCNIKMKIKMVEIEKHKTKSQTRALTSREPEVIIFLSFSKLWKMLRIKYTYLLHESRENFFKLRNHLVTLSILLCVGNSK